MAGRVSGYVWKHSKHKGSTLLVLLALAECAHPDGDGAYPSLRMLSEMTRLSERAVRYALRQIEASGEVFLTPSGGPHGANLWRVLLPEIGLQTLPPSKTEGGNPASVGGQTSVSRGAIAVAPEPLGTVIEPSKVRAAATAPPKKVRDEEAAAVREATSLWVAERARHRELSGEAYARFTDPAALRNLSVSVRRSLIASEWRDILQGIRVGASRPNSNPYYADEWAREQGGLRVETERMTAAMDARQKEDGELRREYQRKTPKHISEILRLGA